MPNVIGAVRIEDCSVRESRSKELTEVSDKLADLFDKSKMNARRQKAEDKLRNLQNSDGSWSWFEGMEGNIHITTTVVEHIAELEKA